jgi:hypothetical protein
MMTNFSVKPYFVLALAAGAGTAFAAPENRVGERAHSANWICRDLRAGPDHGYEARIRGLRAEISSQSLAGPRTLAVLKCARPALPPRPRHPDEEYAVLNCRQPGLYDAGYLLDVSAGGFTGRTRATLSTQSIAGPRPVAQLLCQTAR